MSCDWTEKVSLLIDGELPFEEARLAEQHVSACPACLRASEDFLSLREAVSSYPLMSDSSAAARALENILASAASHTDSESSTPARVTLRERLSLLLPRMNPALASAVSVLVFAVALGIIWSLLGGNDLQQTAGQRQQNVTDTGDGQTAGANMEQTQLAREITPTLSVSENASGLTPMPSSVKDKDTGGQTTDTLAVNKTPPRRSPLAREIRSSSEPRVETASLENEGARRAGNTLAVYSPLFSPEDDALDEAQRLEPAQVGGVSETERHLERAQVLLRSVRNARADEGASTIADERRRSQQLLYRNVVLRREAAREGNPWVERALDSLEPILIDIANLPERPSAEAVRAIQQRIERKNISAVIQANIAAVPRAY